MEIVEQYGSWLSKSPVPKLLIKAGARRHLGRRTYEFSRTWPNQRETNVQGIHFVQEDSPLEIGAALREFVASYEAK